MKIKTFEFTGTKSLSFEDIINRMIPYDSTCLVLDHPRAGRILHRNLPKIRNMHSVFFPTSPFAINTVLRLFDRNDSQNKIFFLELTSKQEQKLLALLSKRGFLSSVWLIYNKFRHNKEMIDELSRLMGLKFPKFDSIFTVEYAGHLHNGHSPFQYFYMEE